MGGSGWGWGTVYLIAGMMRNAMAVVKWYVRSPDHGPARSRPSAKVKTLKEADMNAVSTRASSSSMSCASRDMKSGTGASPRSAEHRPWTAAFTLGDE